MAGFSQPCSSEGTENSVPPGVSLWQSRSSAPFPKGMVPNCSGPWSHSVSVVEHVLETDSSRHRYSARGTMWSKALKRNLAIERCPKNLFLMDLNQLWSQDDAGSTLATASCVAQTELSDDSKISAAENQGSLCQSEPNRVSQDLQGKDSQTNSSSFEKSALDTHGPFQIECPAAPDQSPCGRRSCLIAS